MEGEGCQAIGKTTRNSRGKGGSQATPSVISCMKWRPPNTTLYFSIHGAATLEITLACSLNVISNEPFSTLLVLGCPYSSFAKTKVWGHCTWLPTWTCHEDDPEPSWYFSQGLLLPCEWSSSGWCLASLSWWKSSKWWSGFKGRHFRLSPR